LILWVVSDGELGGLSSEITGMMSELNACQFFGCLPSQIIKEDAGKVFKMMQLETWLQEAREAKG